MNGKKQKLGKMPIDPLDERELFDNDFAVESMTECTGLIPAGQVSAAEAESYSEIYDIPISQVRCGGCDTDGIKK